MLILKRKLILKLIFFKIIFLAYFTMLGPPLIISFLWECTTYIHQQGIPMNCHVFIYFGVCHMKVNNEVNLWFATPCAILLFLSPIVKSMQSFRGEMVISTSPKTIAFWKLVIFWMVIVPLMFCDHLFFGRFYLQL